VLKLKNAKPLQPVYRAILLFIRATPLSRGKARRIILKAIKKRVAHPIITDFRGIPFVFNLDNTTESKALFGRYNLEELDFMRSAVSTYAQPVFVDLGANSGFYTQNFLALGRGLALAIEPNPAMCQRTEDNYDLLRKTRPNCNSRLVIECCAAGESAGTVELDLSHGFGGANIVHQKGSNTVSVRMSPFLDILKRNHINRIHVMKVDIEGYEDKALIPFFTQADPRLFPYNIIIEHTSSDQWEGDLFRILNDRGYIVVGKTRGNMLFRLSRCVVDKAHHNAW